MRAVTGKPIKLIGTGEKLDAIEDFHPQRIADRILGMGDIVSLVERQRRPSMPRRRRASREDAQGRLRSRRPREQLTQMQSLGGMTGLMAMLPGVAKIKNQLAERNLDEKVSAADGDHRFDDAGERRNPDLLKRAASGASPPAPAPSRRTSTGS